jgi:hypothetical protein
MHAYLLQVISWLVGEKILAQEDLNKHSFSVRRELTVILIFSVEESLSLDGKSFVTFYYFRKVLKNYLSARCRVSFVGGCGLDLGGLDLVVSTLWCRPCGVDLVVSTLWCRPCGLGLVVSASVDAASAVSVVSASAVSVVSASAVSASAASTLSVVHRRLYI